MKINWELEAKKGLNWNYVRRLGYLFILFHQINNNMLTEGIDGHTGVHT